MVFSCYFYLLSTSSGSYRWYQTFDLNPLPLWNLHPWTSSVPSWRFISVASYHETQSPGRAVKSRVADGLYILLKWMAKTHSGMWIEAWCPLNGIVGFTVWLMILQQWNHLLLINSFGQTINSIWVALCNSTYLIPPPERRFRSGSHLQHLTRKDNEKQFTCKIWGFSYNCTG